MKRTNAITFFKWIVSCGKYKKQDNKKGEKTMANIAISIMTILMMVCAGIKVM